MKKSFWDSFVNIKNAQSSKKTIVYLKKNKKVENLLKLLWFEHFILGYKIINRKIKVFLKYLHNKPLINFVKYIPKVTKEVYFCNKKIWKITNKSSVFIFSTNTGLQSLKDCKKNNVGGKLILIIQ